MEKLIEDTIENANQYFVGLGFQKEQVEALLESGKRDLSEEVHKLSKLLGEEPINIDTINLSLHALKGLFLMMGNTKIADKLNELRQENQNHNNIIEIKQVLNI